MFDCGEGPGFVWTTTSSRVDVLALSPTDTPTLSRADWLSGKSRLHQGGRKASESRLPR